MPTSRISKTLKLVAGLSALPLALTACGAGGGGGSSTGDIYIAASNPMTGDSGYYGADKVKAIKLALSEVNKSGGIKGRKIKLIVNDDAGQPAQGASLAAKECADNRIRAVIGHWNSSVSLAAVPIYARCKLVSINDNTAAKLSGISPYSFRIFATGDFEGKVLAQYAWAKGFRKTAVVYDTNDYGLSLSTAFGREFKALGGSVVLNDSYVEGNKNFAPDAQKVKASGADSSFIAGYYVESALIAKAIRAAGVNHPLMGGDGIDAPQLTQLGGEAVEGMVFADDYAPELKSAENTAFVKKWQAAYHANPDTFAALAYDATNLLIAAMKGGATERESIQKSIKAESDFTGVTGPIRFDSKNDAARNVYLLTVSGGKIVLNKEQMKDGAIVPADQVLK